MKTNWRFTLNLEWGLLEKDEKAFKQEVYSFNQVWYYFPHYYNDEDDSISSYWWLVVKTKNKKILERVDYVKEIYWIDPHSIVMTEWEYHIVFNLNKGIDANRYKAYQKALEFIYSSKAIDYHFYNDETIVKVVYESEKKSSPITALAGVNSIIQNKQIERHFDKNNLEQYNKANSIPFSDIVVKLWDDSDALKIDEEKWIHVLYGRQFEYVTNMLESRADTIEFFNTNYWLTFTTEKEDLEEIREWVFISDWQWFFKNDRWYYTVDKDDRDIQITDFHIKVHYRLIKSDKEKVFIVSLINEWSDERTNKIEWINSTSKWPFCDFLQKLWNFHFTWMNLSFITSIHKIICRAKVPDVKYITWYWFHREEGIVILRNWIWDIKENIFTPVIEWDKYYFNYNWKGYFPSDKSWNALYDTIGSFVPSMWDKNLVELDDILTFMMRIYNDSSWVLLIMMVMWIIWNWMFSDKKWEFPIFFIRGLTGSGKTKYSEILQYIFWSGKPSEFSSSSSFTMTMLFTYLRSLPYFITEYRENSKDKDNKVSILRSNYDGSGQTKGKPDQTVISYEYSAIPIIDWQEMITDPALRTRSVQVQFLSKHKIKWNFDKLYSEWKWLLKWFLYTYLNLAKGDKYNEYRNEWYDLFKSHSDRLRQNMASVYAGCMAFDEKKKDLYIEILNESLIFQNLDYKENWDDMQIINAIARFLESRDSYSNIWDIPEERCLMISWAWLEEYIKLRRVDLSLKIDTYKASLENMWYHIWKKRDKVEWIQHNGIIIPYDNIPSEFLCHRDFYKVQIQQEREWELLKLNV